MHRLTAAALLLLGAGCSTAQLVTYNDAGIRLSGSITGILERRGGCITVATAGERFVPIWPRGTHITELGLRLPQPNGISELRFNHGVRLFGGIIRPLSASAAANFQNGSRALSCGSSGFIVNTATMEDRIAVN